MSIDATSRPRSGPAKKLAIIDGKSVFYRGYYAMPNLAAPDGTPTGGVFGFATMALEVIRRLKPDYVAVAWDKPKTNIRKRLDLYPAYKAGRKPAPADFYEQVPLLHQLLDAFGWPLYELDDYEADDIMGTLAVQAAKLGIETLLVTSDLDLLQLVDPHIRVYALKTGLSNIELYSPKSFQAKYGIKATQFLDFKALKGDASDNIPGVPGIGQKGAAELLKQHGTLDGVYDNLQLIKDSTRKKLAAGKESAYLSKKLASIWTDAPIKLDLGAMDGSGCDPARIRDLFRRLQFRQLERQLPEVMRLGPDPAAETDKTLLRPAIVSLVTSLAQLKTLEQSLAADHTPIVLHSYCRGRHSSELKYLAVSPGPGECFLIDCDRFKPAALTYIFKADRQLVGCDVKLQLKAIMNLGLKPPAVEHDVLVAAFLLNSLRRGQSLSELARTDLNYDGPELEAGLEQEYTERVGYMTAAIWKLYDYQRPALAGETKLQKVADEIEWPLIEILASMELAGIKLDVAVLARLSEQIEDVLQELQANIFKQAKGPFNIGSPQQLADVLFNRLGLSKAGIKKGKLGFSTAAAELDKLRLGHPIINMISQWREVTKLKNTYIDTLPKQVDERSRLHTTFSQTVAQTGRLSSNDPNLQNIPVRSELGRQIRSAFVAEPGNLLVSADYSQFELRLAAHLSGDEELIKLFNDDVDVHLATAAEIYGRQPEDVTKNMRRQAKVVNFGVMYGLSAHGLSVAANISRDQAQHFIDRYFEIRPKLVSYIESVKEQARTNGYVETIFGRRRPTPDVKSSNFQVREAALRQAVNMPFQGSAADIMKLAMIKIYQRLEREAGYSSSSDEASIGRWLGGRATGCRILLQIHDSLIVECPEDRACAVAELLKQTMENACRLPVKLTVDTATGSNWGIL